MDGWCCQGAWALWRLCVSDFYQGKPIRPDRGMMILGHHHSGDTAPTNPTTPSSIRQPKTPSHAPSFSFAPPDSPYPLSFSPPLRSIPSFLSSFPFPPFPSPPLSQYYPRNTPSSHRSLFSLFYIRLSCPLSSLFPSSLALSLSLPPLLSDGKHKDKFCPFLSPWNI